MERLDLLLNTFKGNNEDYPLFSLWKHFPYDDKDPKKLTEAHVKFYLDHKFDLMKISPHGRYSVVDFGCNVAKKYDKVTGSTKCKRCCIQELEDWQKIEQLDVGEGELGKQLQTIKMINKQLEGLPKMMTVFSPLMTASKMDPKIVKNLRSDPDLMIESLFTLLDVTTEFALASIDAGANGIFLASQHFRKTELTWQEVQRFEISFLKKFLSIVKKKAEFIVLHLHGQEIKFKEVSKALSVDALNWHDQLTWPSMTKAAKLFEKGLLAGIDETKTLVEGKKDDIKRSIGKAYEISKNNNNRLIIAPGCVIPITAPDESIDVISTSIHKLRKRG